MKKGWIWLGAAAVLVLLCNLPGHFVGGMHTDFTVT
jgi:hypothetical protein